MSNLWLEYSIFYPWGTLKISWNSSLGYYLQVGNDILFYTIFVSSNLSGNKLDDSVPEALIQKSRDGSMILRSVFHAIYFIFLYIFVVLISSPPPPPPQKKLSLSKHAKPIQRFYVHLFRKYNFIYIYIYI